MADPENYITRGALNAILTDPERAESQFPVPVLQCLQLKNMNPKTDPNAVDRWRLVLSDIDNYVQCILATQANHIITENKVTKGSIVRLRSFQSNTIKERKVLIILDIEVVESLGAPDKIGNPTVFGGEKEAETSNASAVSNTTIGGSGFYGTKQEDTKPVAIKKPNQPTRGAGPSNGHHTIYPIEGLSSFAHKWTIKARVSYKSAIKTWHKNNSEGKLFSVNLLDESGEIKATAFNDQVDQFYDVLQEGQVYYISTPCRAQFAKKQFTNLPHDYELSFERDTLIELAEDQNAVPQVRFNFCGIQALNNVAKDTVVDVIGVLKEASEVATITSKTTQKDYSKRELTIVDDSRFSIRVTIWGETATSFDPTIESVIGFKGVKVSDFGGRSLSLLSSGSMIVDPDIPEAHQLKGWYDASGRMESFSTHDNIASMGAATGRKTEDKNIFQVKEMTPNSEDEAFYFNLKATIVYIKQENFCYPACLNDNCNKKVIQEDQGWRCENCNVTHDKPQYRYIMSANVDDHTGQLWLTCFDEVARVIMGGKSADEMMALKETDEAKAAAEFEAANCAKYNFRCRGKMDTYGEQSRVRNQVMNISHLDYAAEATKLAELIKQYDMI